MSATKDSEHLFVVTGASRGIGKAITFAIVNSKLSNSSHTQIVLTSTKQSDLEVVKSEIEKHLATTKHSSTRNITIHIKAIDFSLTEGIEASIKQLYSIAQPKNKFNHVVLILNHGSLGGLQYFQNVHTDASQLLNAINVNITSCIMCCSIALKEFNGNCDRLDLVNISSLAAIQPFESWGLYCIGKAARDMMMKVVASETSQDSEITGTTSVKTLNYAPGPVDTDMQGQIRAEAVVESQKALYTNLKDTGTLVAPDQTSTVLLSILEKNEYQSGDHLDYYDNKLD